jgi:glycerol dehydrogenase-like iron-containing ADH family enzyme
MNLKQLLRNAGISNNIIKEVERKAKQTNAQTEQEHQEKAAAMAKMLLNDVMPHLHSALSKTPPSKPKKTIIVPDDM